MALTLPQGTTVGETYTDGTSTWVYNGTGWEYLDPAKTYFQAEAPAVAVEGQNWTDTDNGRLYTYLQGQWINEGSVFKTQSTETKSITLPNAQGTNTVGSPATWRDVDELDPKLQKFANPDNSGTSTSFGGQVAVSNNYMATYSRGSGTSMLVDVYKKVDKKWNHISQITGLSLDFSTGTVDLKRMAIYDMSNSIMNTFGSSPTNTGGCLLAVADGTSINNPGELYTTKGKVHIYGIAGDQVKEIGAIECPLRDEEANYGDGNYEAPAFGAHIQFIMPAVDSDAWRRGEGEIIVTAPQYRSASRSSTYSTGRVFKFKLPHQPTGSTEHILPLASTSLANWNTMYNSIVPGSKIASYRKEGVKGFGSTVAVLDNNDLAIGAGTDGNINSRDRQSVLLYDEANYPGDSFTHLYNSDGTTNDGAMLGQLGRTSVDNSVSWIAYGDGLASGGKPFTPTDFSDPDQIRQAELGESSLCGEVIIYHKASKKSIRLQTPEINGIRQTNAHFGQSVAIWNDCILLVGAPNAIGYAEPTWPDRYTLENWNSQYSVNNCAMQSYNMAIGHGSIFMYALETSSSGSPVVTELAKWGIEGGTTPEIYNSPFYYFIFMSQIAEDNSQPAMPAGCPSINGTRFGAPGSYSDTSPHYFGWDIKISPDQMTMAVSCPENGPHSADPNQNNGSMTLNGVTRSYSGDYSYQQTFGSVMLFNLRGIGGISQSVDPPGYSNSSHLQNPLACAGLNYDMIKYQVPANSLALSNTKLVVGYKNVKFNHDPENYADMMWEASNHGYAAVYDISSTGSNRPSATFRSILKPEQINMDPFGAGSFGPSIADESRNDSIWWYYGQSVAVSDNYIAVSASGLSPNGNGAQPRIYGQSSLVYVYDANNYTLVGTCDTNSQEYYVYSEFNDPNGRTDHNLYPIALYTEDRYTVQGWNGSSVVDGPWAYNAKFANNNLPFYQSLGNFGAVGASLEISGEKILVGAPEISSQVVPGGAIHGVIFTFDMTERDANNNMYAQSVQHSENYDITGTTWNQNYPVSGFGFSIQPAVEAHGSETLSDRNSFYETLMPYTLKSRTIDGKIHISVPYGMRDPNFQDSSMYYSSNVSSGYGRDLVINDNYSAYGGVYIFDSNGNYKNLLSPTVTQTNSVDVTDYNILSSSGTTGDSLAGKFGQKILTTDNYLIVYDPNEHVWSNVGVTYQLNIAYVPSVSIFNKSDLSFVAKIRDPDWGGAIDYLVTSTFGAGIAVHGNKLYITAAVPYNDSDQTMVDKIHVYDLDTRALLTTIVAPNRESVLAIMQAFNSSITSFSQGFGRSMSISDKNMVFGAPSFINGNRDLIGAFYVASTAKDGVDVYYSKHSDDNISTDLQSLDTATEHTQEFIGYITGSTYESSTIRRLGAVTINTASTAQGDGFASSTGTSITSWDPETSGYVQTLVPGISYYGMITYSVVPGETEGSPMFSLMGMNPDTNEIQIPGVPGNETHILDGTRLFFVGVADSETNISLLPNPTDLVQPTMLSTNSGGGSVTGTLPTAEGMPKPWETV